MQLQLTIDKLLRHANDDACSAQAKVNYIDKAKELAKKYGLPAVNHRSWSAHGSVKFDVSFKVGSRPKERRDPAAAPEYWHTGPFSWILIGGRHQCEKFYQMQTITIKHKRGGPRSYRHDGKWLWIMHADLSETRHKLQELIKGVGVWGCSVCYRVEPTPLAVDTDQNT